MKQTCSSCHYFVRTLYPDRGEPHTFEISRQSRSKAMSGDFSWQKDIEALRCYREIWDEGVGFPESSKIEQVSKIRRNGQCFYFPYQPGMLLPAAEKVQESRLVQIRELQRVRLAIYALLISILALLAKLVLGGT